jgi:hypothetical protein
MAGLAVWCLVPGVAGHAQGKGDVELVVRGCLKGRELTAIDIAGSDDLVNQVGAVFRLSAKGDVEKTIKSLNGRLVDITGHVKKTALASQGFKLGGGRVVIGSSPMSTDPTRDPARSPSARIYPMQATLAAEIAEKCTVFKD